MRRPAAVISLLVFQVICAALFAFETLNSIFGFAVLSVSWAVHELIELGAVLGLAAGGILGAQALKLSWRRTEHAEGKLADLSQAFSDLVSSYFDKWELTSAERDVALFLIKGMSTAEIAALRETSEGTVKAQSNAIYRKAEVASRAQLVSLLIDDLMQDDFFAGAAIVDPEPDASCRTSSVS